MLIRYLENVPVAYDGMHVSHEKKGTKKNVEDKLAKSLILSGRAEMYTGEEVKAVKEYEDKQIKEYSNKSATAKRGRPKKEIK